MRRACIGLALTFAMDILTLLLPVVGWAAPSLITTRRALGATDTVDWGQLGAPFDLVPNPFSVASAGGLSILVSKSTTGDFVRLNQCQTDLSQGIACVNAVGWAGNFAVGDRLIFTGEAGPGPVISIVFPTPVVGAGAQIQSGPYGDFSAVIRAFDSAGNLLGATNTDDPRLPLYTFLRAGNSTATGDNAAIFLGVRESAPVIKRIEFQASSPEARSLAFAINQLDAVLEAAPPACVSPADVFVDNSGALGLFEGAIERLSFGERTTASLVLRPTAVIANPLRLGRRGIALWFRVASISIGPDSEVADIEADAADPLGELAAEAGVVPPGGRASYLVHFCAAGKVTFRLTYDATAAAITLANAIVPIVSLSRVAEFGDALLGVPLYGSAVAHYVKAWQATSVAGLLEELRLAGRDLRDLTRDRAQLQQLREVFRSFLRDFVLRELVSRLILAPVRLLEVYIDTIVHMLQAGVPSRDVEIVVIGH